MLPASKVSLYAVDVDVKIGVAGIGCLSVERGNHRAVFCLLFAAAVGCLLFAVISPLFCISVNKRLLTKTHKTTANAAAWFAQVRRGGVYVGVVRRAEPPPHAGWNIIM